MSERRSKKPRTRRARAGASFETARELGLAFPGAEVGTSYGTPALKVRGKLFVRLHQNGEHLVVHCDFDAREVLLRAHPEHFEVTDHYRDHPWVLARLATVPRSLLAEVIEAAWLERAPKRLAEAYREGSDG